MYRILTLTMLICTLILFPGTSFAEGPVPQPSGGYMTFLPMVNDGKNSSTNLFDSASMEVQLYNAINDVRKANGCPALQLSSELSTAARAHSTDMAYNDFYEHSGSDGSDAAARVEQAGYHWMKVSEIIAAGPMSVDEAVQVWMNSPLHRAKILKCDLQDTGIGFVYLESDPGTVSWHSYWTVDFATR